MTSQRKNTLTILNWWSIANIEESEMKENGQMTDCLISTVGRIIFSVEKILLKKERHRPISVFYSNGDELWISHRQSKCFAIDPHPQLEEYLINKSPMANISNLLIKS